LGRGREAETPRRGGCDSGGKSQVSPVFKKIGNRGMWVNGGGGTDPWRKSGYLNNVGRREKPLF